MSKIGAPLTLVTFLGIVFVLGVFSSSLWLITPAFCLWTPAIFWLGSSFARLGKINISFSPTDKGQSITPKELKQRQSSGQAYQ
jgi:hypothetical protein